MSTLRIRSIHHDALRSRKLAQLTAEAERCWWRLQCVCDDDGRSEDEPDVLTSVLFQVMRAITPEQVDGWLQEMHDVGLIVRYEMAGKRCFHVVGWHDKQKPRRPQTSRLPAPPSPPVAPRPPSSDSVGTRRDSSVSVPQEGLGRGEEMRRGEGESEGEGASTASWGQAGHRLAAQAARYCNGSSVEVSTHGN